MKYEKIWGKVLGSEEEVEFEFSVSDQYRKVNLIIWGIISFPFLFVGGLGVIMFLIALFIFGFYLKVANAYAFTNKRILIHRGWLSTNITSIDYPKITDINAIEPFISRIIYKSGHLKINTAGTNLHEVVLRHVDRPYEIKKKLDYLKDK